LGAEGGLFLFLCSSADRFALLEAASATLGAASSTTERPMRTTFSAHSLTAIVAILAPLCAGCPNANTYGTPRTVPKGEIQHSVAVEGIGWAIPDQTSGNTTVSGLSGFLPTLPTYTLRVGVHDRIDIGARVSNLTSLGVDGKFNFIKGVFDLAIDPGVQVFYFPSSAGSAGIFYFHAPILLGVNPTDWFSIVLTPGIVGVLATTSVNSSSGRDAVTTGSGVLARIGLGLDFRISQGFAIHPEVTMMRSFDSSGMLFNAGIGFNFGKLPSYADIRGETLPEDMPRGAPGQPMPPPGQPMPPSAAPQ